MLLAKNEKSALSLLPALIVRRLADPDIVGSLLLIAMLIGVEVFDVNPTLVAMRLVKTPEELAAHIKKELATWSKVVKAAGVRVD